MHQNRTIYDYSVYLIQADLVRNLPKALLGFSDFSDTRTASGGPALLIRL